MSNSERFVVSGHEHVSEEHAYSERVNPFGIGDQLSLRWKGSTTDRRTPVDDTPDRLAMTLAIRMDTVKMAER